MQALQENLNYWESKYKENPCLDSAGNIAAAWERARHAGINVKEDRLEELAAVSNEYAEKVYFRASEAASESENEVYKRYYYYLHAVARFKRWPGGGNDVIIASAWKAACKAGIDASPAPLLEGNIDSRAYVETMESLTSLRFGKALTRFDFVNGEAMPRPYLRDVLREYRLRHGRDAKDAYLNSSPSACVLEYFDKYSATLTVPPEISY